MRSDARRRDAEGVSFGSLAALTMRRLESKSLELGSLWRIWRMQITGALRPPPAALRGPGRGAAFDREGRGPPGGSPGARPARRNL